MKIAKIILANINLQHQRTVEVPHISQCLLNTIQLFEDIVQWLELEQTTLTRGRWQQVLE